MSEPVAARPATPPASLDVVADALVRAAALALDAPIALACLAAPDGDQVVLGGHGLSWPDRRRPGPVLFGLSTAVVGGGLPVIVADTATDRRGVRRVGHRDDEVAAFAGFPVKDAREHCIGAMCVIDRVPRAWTTRQLAVVDQLAQALTGYCAVVPVVPRHR